MKTKTLFTFGLAGYLVLTTVLITAAKTAPPTQIISSTAINNSTPNPLTMSDVAKHTSVDSCWMVISGNVYDVTAEINNHPGRANEILKYCGTDATDAFNTKDGRGQSHSSFASSQLAQMLVGPLATN